MSSENLPNDLINEFLDLACLNYGNDEHVSRRSRASELLAGHPALAAANIYTAAVTGNLEALAQFLARNPDQIAQEGGPRDWEPLLYAAYARIPGMDTLPVARALLDAGANPDAHFWWGGQYKFTALTGAFGSGEQGLVQQPPHPQWEAFARLLLDAGANPNDSQALYNRMFNQDNRCLELLLEYGLNKDHMNNWRDCDGSENTERVFDYQSNWAAQKNHPKRLRLLLEHGANPNGRCGMRSLLEHALLRGHKAVAAILTEFGATPPVWDPADALAAAIAQGDRSAVDALVAEEPGLLTETQAAHPNLLHHAASDGYLEAAQLMLDLGFPINRITRFAPLHEAVHGGQLEMLQFLIEHGADTTLREPHFNSTAIGHANHNGNLAFVAYLMTQPLDMLDAIHFAPERVPAMLDANPALLEQPFSQCKHPAARPDDVDWRTPLAFAVAEGNAELVKLFLSRGASTSVAAAGGGTLRDWAQPIASAEIRTLLG